VSQFSSLAKVAGRIVIIGAGPAGLAALRQLQNSSQALHIEIIDSNSRIGGQYWRHQEGSEFPAIKFDPKSYSFTANRKNEVLWHLSSSVWQIEKNGQIFRLHIASNVGDKAATIEVEKIIIATGASERTLPFKNWTTPGVMSAGALQSLAKEYRVIPGKKIVIAGSGVFAMPVAKTIKEVASKCGIEVEVTIIEAQSILRWWRNSLAFLLNPSKIVEALGFLIFMKRHSVKRLSKRMVKEVKSENGKIVGVHLTKVGSDLRSKEDAGFISADLVATSFGFTPDMTLASILGLERKFQDGDAVVAVDSNQRTSIDGVWAAGEITGIGGHELAITEGLIAARNLLNKQSRLLKWRRLRERFFARGLRTIYPISKGWIESLDDAEVVCRCEEVCAGEIKESAKELGADSARSAKLFTRAGMGLCQGRICQRNVAEIIDFVRRDARDTSDANRETVRPIGGVVTLGGLSD
jgi:NADPH-dependent 2,4-dienoyl-CoA reductase/sulfur reductase-like enzyme